MFVFPLIPRNIIYVVQTVLLSKTTVMLMMMMILSTVLVFFEQPSVYLRVVLIVSLLVTYILYLQTFNVVKQLL
jgi:hypothetical protein